LQRSLWISCLAVAAILLAGCPKSNQSEEYSAGRKAEAIGDYDTALIHYEHALRADPNNAEYKLRASNMRYAAGQFHIDQGKKALKSGDLQLALAEFEKGQALDPSNPSADQYVKQTMQAIGAQQAAQSKSRPDLNPPDDQDLLSAPPELKPLSREPINLKMTNDSRVVFETVGKLAGLSVLFDPDYTSRRITAELPNVTLEEALDDIALESKAFWKPLSSSVIFVAPDTPQKRKDLEDEEVRTFYLSNTVTPQDLTEIVTGLRQLLDLHRVQQVNAQNAIVIRETPDKLALAAKIIRDIDKAKPEVLIHVQVLTANRSRLVDLGILPGQSVALTFTPRCSVQPYSSTSSTNTNCSTSSSSTTSGTSIPQITLNNLQHLSTADYSLTLPGATANAILTDNATRIIQDPEVRVTDGQKATLKIGDRVPVATGSFQAGVGVGVGSGAGVVNPLVNTQFQYIDVGVNIDVTPRVHPDGDVSLKLSVEVSQISGTSNIGGISQPIISQRKVEHDVRLKEGEVSLLGGLIERDQDKNINGIPGLGDIPMFRYLFSDNSNQVTDNEVLIVLTPHVIRMPSISADDLRPLAAGTDSNVRVYHDEEEPQPGAPQTGTPPSSQQIGPGPGAGAASTVEGTGGAAAAAGGTATLATPAGQTVAASAAAPSATQLLFQPENVTMKTGDTVTLGLAVNNVTDLYSIPLMIQYNPAIVEVEEVRNGGFLSGGKQEIAIVQRIDQERGQVIISATRQPNTPGVNGSGTLLGITLRALAPGSSPLQIVMVNAHNSQQQTIPMVTGVATVQVK
jgi:general secretion pathway protein D